MSCLRGGGVERDDVELSSGSAPAAEVGEAEAAESSGISATPTERGRPQRRAHTSAASVDDTSRLGSDDHVQSPVRGREEVRRRRATGFGRS